MDSYHLRKIGGPGFLTTYADTGLFSSRELLSCTRSQDGEREILRNCDFGDIDGPLTISEDHTITNPGFLGSRTRSISFLTNRRCILVVSRTEDTLEWPVVVQLRRSISHGEISCYVRDTECIKDLAEFFDNGDITLKLEGCGLWLYPSFSTKTIDAPGMVPGVCFGVNLWNMIRSILSPSVTSGVDWELSSFMNTAGLRVSLGPPPESKIVVNMSSWGILLVIESNWLQFRKIFKASVTGGRVVFTNMPLHSKLLPEPIGIDNYACVRQSGAIEVVFISKKNCCSTCGNRVFVSSVDVETSTVVIDAILPREMSVCVSAKIIATTTMARTETTRSIISEVIPLIVKFADKEKNCAVFIERIPLRWAWVRLLVQITRNQ